jgi:hypothetical protein
MHETTRCNRPCVDLPHIAHLQSRAAVGKSADGARVNTAQCTRRCARAHSTVRQEQADNLVRATPGCRASRGGNADRLATAMTMTGTRTTRGGAGLRHAQFAVAP